MLVNLVVYAMIFDISILTERTKTMIDPAFRMRVAKVDYRMTSRLIEHLLKEIVDCPRGSIERIDRIAILKQLIDRQKSLQSVVAAARLQLLAELRPAPINPAALRESTRQEIENIDWDEHEREELIRKAAHAATAQRRQQLLERLKAQRND